MRYGEALAEALNSLYKAELIDHRGPWTSIDDVDAATSEWVHWFNTARPHSSIEYRSPAEFDEAYPNGRATDSPGVEVRRGSSSTI